MADDVNSSISVTGNLKGLMLDDFELFFESQRFCPNGGDVKEIQWISKNSVKITFHDSKVVGRLEKCLTMPGDVHLFIEPFVDSNSNVADEIHTETAVFKGYSADVVSSTNHGANVESDSSDPEEINQDNSNSAESKSVRTDLVSSSKPGVSSGKIGVESDSSDSEEILQDNVNCRESNSVRKDLVSSSRPGVSSGKIGVESDSSDSEEIRRDNVNSRESTSSLVRTKWSGNEDVVSLNSSGSSFVSLEDDFCPQRNDEEIASSFSLSHTESDLRRNSTPNNIFMRSTSFINRKSSPQIDNHFNSLWKSFSSGKISQVSNRTAVNSSSAVSYKRSRTKSQNPVVDSDGISRENFKLWNSVGPLSRNGCEKFGGVGILERDGELLENSDSELVEIVKKDFHSSDEISGTRKVDPLSGSCIGKRQNESVKIFREKITEKLSFSSEKLKLIKLVVDAKGMASDCVLNFDEHQQLIIVNGSNDAVVSTKFLLHEIILFAVNSRVKIPQHAQKLLLSKKGREWITEEFAKRHLLSVFYTKDGQAHVISADDVMLQQTCDLVEKSVIGQSIPFDDSAMTFLQSSTWAKKVDETESCSLISIDTDYFQKIVTVTGRAADVKTCCLDIQELLMANSKKTQSIRHKIGVVRLLKSQAHSITNEINQDLSSRVQLEFDQKKGTIVVTGRLNDVDKAVNHLQKNYLNAVCYDKYEVNKQGLTLEMFTCKNNPGSDLIDLIELRDKCVIEVRGNSSRAPSAAYGEVEQAAERVQVKVARKKKRINVQQGSIVDFEADVLVNSIANRSLERGGVINQCFLRAGGSRLYQEMRGSVPQDFGHDVVMTSAGGKIKAEFILHAAIRKYHNQDSVERLYNLIKKCLEMADKQNARSIAFPTLGCGKLGFAPKDVADSFTRAVKNTRTNLQISIIAFEDHLVREFKTHLTQDLSEGSSDSESKESSWFGGKFRKLFSGISYTRKMPVSNQIVFHINAWSNDVVQRVRGTLAAKISEMITESPIKDEAISELSDETLSRIAALGTSEVEINIDKAKQTITVKGIKSQVEQVKMKVMQLVYKEGARNESPGHFLPQSSFRFPKHWSLSRRSSGTTSGFHLSDLSEQSNGEIFKEVSDLIMKTWEPNKVGHGNDAAGLGPHTIKIRKISCVENSSLYRKYMSRREELVLGSSVNYCPPVKGLQKEGQIMTLNLGLKKLDANLAKNINECYLLHGTKVEIVDSIQHTGLDSRLSGTHVLFGQGTYFTESSTKADQYADSKNKRKANGSPLYMYICRVLPGNVFVCQTPKNFKRAPCMQCLSDLCDPPHQYAGYFDSVIGTHKAPSTRLLFREFVIYHPEQSYPEFLVEYERQ